MVAFSVRIVARVDVHVVYQIALAHKFRVAYCALERFTALGQRDVDDRVRSGVFGQRRAAHKGFVAFVARVWLNSGMRAHVNGQAV